MTTGAEVQGGAAKVEAQRPPRLWVCFGLVGLYWIVLLIASPFLGRIEMKALVSSWGMLAGIAVAVAVVGAMLWEFRRHITRTVTSLPFSIAQLGFLLGFTVLGTVFLQQAEPAAYAQRHGQAIASVLLALGLDDLFHTSWFTGLLALQGVSLVLTAIEKRAWRLHMWGHGLSHLGFVTVLVGGWIGSQFGFKGMIDMHEGQEASEVRIDGKRGVQPSTRPLGFALKLEKFAVEHYGPEAKFYVYERDGEQFRGVRSFDQQEAGQKRPIGSSGASFRLVKAYPDFYLRPEVREAPAGQGKAVLQVDFKQGDWSARAALLAGVDGQDATLLSAEGPSCRFVWATPSEAEIARFTEAVPDRHIIALQAAEHGGAAEEVAAAVGATALLSKAGYEVQILEFLPDFTYDTKAKKATSRSQEPNNPAVRVLIREAKTKEEKTIWLYAKMPDFGHGEGAAAGPKFVYRLDPGHQPAAREMLVVGEAKQIWRLERGVVAQRLPLEQWQTACAGLPVVGMQAFASAVVEGVPTTRSEVLDNPVADIVVEEGGVTREVRMAAQHGEPVPFSDGKTFLAFELRANEPKTFQSHLTVLEDGRKVTEKTIVVNDPLSHRGFMFYQSSFRKEDPTYSGIQVVRDPGLGIVFLGFVMMSIGVIFIYYIRPRIMAGMGEPHGH